MLESNYQINCRRIRAAINPPLPRHGDFFLIVLTGARIWSEIEYDIERIFIDFWKWSIANAYVIANADNNEDLVAKLYTFFPYNAGGCNKVNSVVVNEYHKDKFVHELNVFVDKFSNMHKCPVLVTIPKLHPLIKLATDENGEHSLEGFEGNTLDYISSAMNIQLEAVIVPYPSKYIANVREMV